MPRPALALLFAVVALAPATALATEDCPDGWFCDDGSPAPGSAPSAPPERPGPRQPAPPSDEPPFPPPGYPSGPPDEPVIFLDQPEQPPPARPHRRPYHEWGFNLHLESALLGDRPQRAAHAEMDGLGFALRYRPRPVVALELGIDLLTGTDFQGYARSEGALLMNTLVFFNPHDVVQIYVLGGLGFSEASVTIAPRAGDLPFNRHDEGYSYFGGQLGLGTEVRVSRRIAIGGDVIGFIRGRIDAKADFAPEFIDPVTHRATNSSGGGLVRVGATFYW